MKSDWKTSYESMRKSLEELQALRHTSVKQDADDLERKIEEHRKIHEISTAELKNQNQQLIDELKRTEEKKKKIIQLKKNIQNLQAKLSNKEPLFSQAFKYQPIIRLTDGTKGEYIFEAGTDNIMKFSLKRQEENSGFIYEPIQLPKGNKNLLDWMNQPCKVSFGAVQKLFSSIANLQA